MTDRPILDRFKANHPVIGGIVDALVGRGEAPTPSNPTGSPKGWLRSRAIWSALVGFVAWLILQQGWVEQGALETILTGLEAAGLGGAAVFRAMASVPTRGSGATR